MKDPVVCRKRYNKCLYNIEGTIADKVDASPRPSIKWFVPRNHTYKKSTKITLKKTNR